MAPQDREPGFVAVEERMDVTIGVWKPLSWSAIVAGAVAALGTQLILTLIGAGIGASVVNPATDPNTRGLGTGAVIWLIASGIISFGVGGYVAGYMSGFSRTSGGALHGMLAWALAAVLGASVTMIAGAATAGPAMLGAGIAARDHTYRTGDTTYRSVDSARNPLTAGQPGELAINTPSGRTTTISDAEARAQAERAAELTGRASLATGIAFFLSLLTSAFCGKFGRATPIRIPTPTGREHGRVAHA